MFEVVKGPKPADRYIADYFREQQPGADAASVARAAEQGVATLEYVRAHPLPVASDEQIKARVPRDRWAPLELHQREFRVGLRGMIFLPKDEEIISERVSCLLSDWGDLHAGTVIYRRETAQAVVVYALPYAILSFATAKFSPGHATNPRRTTTWQAALQATAPFAKAPAAAPAVAAAAGIPGDAIDIVNGIVDVSSSLVWAFPAPWNAIAAGGLTLFRILFNLTDDRESPTITAIKSAVTTLQQFIKQQNIEDKMGDVLAFQEWFMSEQAVLRNIGNNPDYIEERFLPPLNRMLEPGAGTLLKSIHTLEDIYARVEPKTPDDYKQKEAVFHLLVAAISVYLFALRMRIVLDAGLTAYRHEGGDAAAEEKFNGLWLGDYAYMLVAFRGDEKSQIKGWIDKVTAHIDAMKATRLGFVTLEHFPREAHQQVVPGSHGGWIWVVDREQGWGVLDKIVDQRRFAHPDERVSDGCGYKMIEYKGEAEVLFERWRSSIEATDFGKLRDAVKAWRYAADEWYDHRAPQAPTEAVGIGTWLAKTPRGPHWVKGNAVRYTIVFSNNSGRSLKGPYTPWLEIGDQAFPTLTSLPREPLKMATRIYIYRAFRNDNEGKDRRIADIAASETSYRDERE
jgi:hypothetical protein